MLLRLRVRNFKNLEDATVRFGPLTCFVGHNGVGKSNILDAIQFLKLLADHPIQTAAQQVRKPLAGVHEPLDLFLDRDPSARMTLEADILVPARVVDDFGRVAEPAATLLSYLVELSYRQDPVPRLELEREELGYHKVGGAEALMGFSTSPAFRRAVLRATRRGERFISSTHGEIRLHQDGGSRGQPFSPGSSPRTVLGGTNTIDYPTVLAARREMSSWRFFQLEPSAMRSPDPDDGSTGVSEHGEGMAATLFGLSQQGQASEVFLRAAQMLRHLNESVRELRVDRDRARNQLVLQARVGGDAGWLGPRALSDGTLRFLALVTMYLDPSARGIIALEEPENGIHPSRVPELVRLLRRVAVDPRESPADDNPLRQVILNTHSPDVVRQLATDELMWVDQVETARGRRAVVRGVQHTWRGDADPVTVAEVARFIGGSMPIESWLQPPLPLRFGTAV